MNLIILIFFKSEKNNSYRLDFIVLKEKNEDLKDSRLHDKTFISISFSLENSLKYNYDVSTKLNEQFDVMNRINFLINDYNLKENYIYMFVLPDIKKINMYEYFVKICFPDYKIIKDNTSFFNTSKIGYYLIK